MDWSLGGLAFWLHESSPGLAPDVEKFSSKPQHHSFPMNDDDLVLLTTLMMMMMTMMMPVDWILWGDENNRAHTLHRWRMMKMDTSFTATMTCFLIDVRDSCLIIIRFSFNKKNLKNRKESKTLIIISLSRLLYFFKLEVYTCIYLYSIYTYTPY